MTASRLLASLSLALICLTRPVWSQSASDSGDQIAIVIPALGGPTELSKAISQILQLKISQSFRTFDKERPRASLGRGAIRPVAYPLAVQDHREAERLAHVNGAQAVLWGTTLPFKKGAVAQTYLTIPAPYLDFRRDRKEVWRITVGTNILELDFPRRQISFPPITVSDRLVKKFSGGDFPKLCQSRGACISLPSEAFYRVLSWEGDEEARVLYEGKEWRLRLPSLDQYQFQTTSYVIGVIACMRGDWNLALRSMDQVINGPQGTTLKIDAHIYRGLALEGMDKSGISEFEASYKLGRFSVRSIQFLVMAFLAEASRQISGAPRHTLAEKASALLDENKNLFLSDDPWRETAMQIARSLKTP